MIGFVEPLALKLRFIGVQGLGSSKPSRLLQDCDCEVYCTKPLKALAGGLNAKPKKPGLGLGASFFFFGGGGWIFLSHLAYFTKNGLRICQPYGFWSDLFGAPVSP